MSAIRPIRSDADLSAAVARAGDLLGAEPGTAEADELEILGRLIEDFETSRFLIRKPSPVEAIRFRMEQQQLQPRDLIPMIGSRSRVSQVLSGVRPLSIDMIRALHLHFAIPADVLIGAPHQAENAKPAAELSKPAAKALLDLKILRAGESLAAFVARAFGSGPAAAMFRKTRTERTNAKTDVVALQAWCAAAMLESTRWTTEVAFERRALGSSALRELARLSRKPDGPRRARDWLRRRGVLLVTLPHLPGTYLDGAAMMRSDGTPVVALTLRHDRIDNFWFTLLHECVHVALHLEPDEMIIDDLDIGSGVDVEREADEVARQAMISDATWITFGRGAYCSGPDVLAFAEVEGVHPAIVAGRWQMENRDFRRFAKLLGHGEVRHWFEIAER